MYSNYKTNVRIICSIIKAEFKPSVWVLNSSVPARLNI